MRIEVDNVPEKYAQAFLYKVMNEEKKKKGIKINKSYSKEDQVN
jgi:hypothetical protein